MIVLLVALGAAVGAVTRLLVSQRLGSRTGTLVVNVAGSGLLGLLVTTTATSYALVGIGLCGALTTFSTWALETEQGPRGLRYLALTAGLCLAAAAAGVTAGR